MNQLKFGTAVTGPGRWLIEFCMTHRRNDRLLYHTIGEQFAGQSLHLIVRKITLQQVAITCDYVEIRSHAEIDGIGRYGFACPIAFTRRRVNVNFPQCAHIECGT